MFHNDRVLTCKLWGYFPLSNVQRLQPLHRTHKKSVGQWGSRTQIKLEVVHRFIIVIMATKEKSSIMHSAADSLSVDCSYANKGNPSSETNKSQIKTWAEKWKFKLTMHFLMMMKLVFHN